MVDVESDTAIADIGAVDSPEKVAMLLTLLCGEPVAFESLSTEAKAIIGVLVQDLQTANLTSAQFNELLLLFNQDRVQEPFFKFFFLRDAPATSIDVDGLKKGVMRFRLFAMLCFGNFRFAFRKLSCEKDPIRFDALLRPWNLDSRVEVQKLVDRKRPLASITKTADQIAGDKTWLLGYLSSQRLSADKDALGAMIQQAQETASESDIAGLKNLFEEVQELEREAKIERMKGRKNTVKYLTWDYLDVYVATSMRQPWEFESIYQFVENVFLDELDDLPRIRWFDPTQSHCDSIIDKGLVEALMLKRAKCTIYMAQETDTLGKDSELAATLAQGKPVIAYVPKFDGDELKSHAEALANKPPSYFRQRLLALLADGFFDRPDNRTKVSERVGTLGVGITPEGVKTKVQELLQLFARFEKERRFFVVGGDEQKFKENNKAHVIEAAKMLAAIESVAADGRANTIKLSHPLGMQVHLETGVANGVLVARSPKQCADSIRGILRRDLLFSIEPVIDPNTKRNLGTALVDKPTSSRFRFVTSDECITNSFWNFYLEKPGDVRWQNHAQRDSQLSKQN